MTLSRDDILAADDLKTETVDVPEWGGKVIVRELSGTDRDAWEASLTRVRQVQGGKTLTAPDMGNLRAKLVARALIDEAGKLLFSESDVTALGNKSGAALNRCFEVVSRLSGLTDDAVPDAEGNSGTVQGDGSTSNGPTPPESQ